MKKKSIMLAKVPVIYEGLPCFAPSDKADQIELSNCQWIEASLPIAGRTKSQNAVWAVWYYLVSRELGEDTPEGVKCFCKLHYGVPLLQAQDSEFRALYEAAILNAFTYEQKLKIMRYLPVTSRLGKSEGCIYQRTLQDVYAERGIILEVQR